MDESKNIDWGLFMELINRVPCGLDRKTKKTPADKKARDEVIKRDGLKCRVCDLEGKFGNPGFGLEGKLALHHIIPNGGATPDNLIILCKYCHCAVHMILFTTGRWRYVPMK